MHSSMYYIRESLAGLRTEEHLPGARHASLRGDAASRGIQKVRLMRTPRICSRKCTLNSAVCGKI